MAKTRGLQRRQYWQAVVKQQKRSGLSVAAFCRSQGVAEASFYAWKRRLGEGGVEASSRSRRPATSKKTVKATPNKTAEPTPKKTVKATPTVPSEAVSKNSTAPAGFVPVRITDEPRPAMIQVRWPGGLSVRIPADCDQAHVDAVLTAVDALTQPRVGG